jgi:hypothetical protein
MSERESVESWVFAVCSKCAMPFGKEYSYMDMCPYCYKEDNGYKILKGDLAFAFLQQELQRLLDKKKVEEDTLERDPMTDADWEAYVELQEEAESLRKANASAFRKITELEREVSRLKKTKSAPVVNGSGPDLALLRKMIVLCHPDKHKDSPVATEVTQWITGQMTKARP